MGIETSVVKRKGKGKELSDQLDKEENPILSNPKSVSNSGASGGGGPKKAARKKSAKKMALQSPVQKLYDTCKDVFISCGPGIVPPPDKIEKLRAVLDDIKPEDVGLRPDMPYFRPHPSGRNAILYLGLHECSKFSIGIFCYPPSGVIPLHNHPGMTVFSKLLFGKMHVKSYDWVDDGPCNKSDVANPAEVKQTEVQQLEVKEPVIQQYEVKQMEVLQPEVLQPEILQPEVLLVEAKPPEILQPEKQPEVQKPEVKEPVVQQPKVQQPTLRLAKVKIDSNFSAPCNPFILYPADGGNMHCFTAETACAVLDVLGPPYSDPEGRHCTYYHDLPFAKFSENSNEEVFVPEEEKEGYAWLLDIIGKPENFSMIGEVYRGPKILKK